MPDGYDPTAGSGFKGVGAGLLETYFGGLGEERQRVQRQKDQELARQIAAYHALLEHPDTPESEVPNILDSTAKLLKIDKEFAPITAHMREGMKRRVPTGPQTETLDSQVGQLTKKFAAPTGVTPDLPTPETYQPTAEYGSLSQSQAEDARKLAMYGSEQDIQTAKMLQQQKQITERALAVEQQKQTARAAQLETEYKLKRDLLEPKERLAADKQRSGFKQALLSQLGHTPSPEEITWADSKAGEMVIAQADAVLGQRQASAEASKATAKNRLAQIKHWNAQDAHAIRTEATAGMSAANLRSFNANTREVWPELSRVKSEIIRLQTLKAALGASNTQFDPQLQTLEDRRDELQLQIDDARKTLNSSVPTAPGSIRPKSDPLGLYPN